MVQKSISDQITGGMKIVYRRVSTKNQSDNGYRDQLRTIKAHDPNLTLASEHVIDLKENISGFATSEKRMAGEMGRGLRILQRDPSAIIEVASADRISRTTDVFELIVAQGLGHRVKDLSSGLTVAEIVSTGQHLDIASASKGQKKAKQEGLIKYRASGGVLGREGIKDHAVDGVVRLKLKTQAIAAEILGCVRDLVIRKNGFEPSFRAIALLARIRGIRTGQGNLFTQARLRQFKKRHRKAWYRALDSYHRPRRRIRLTVKTISVQFPRKRKALRRTRRLSRLARHKTIFISSFRHADAALCSYFPRANHQRQMTTQRLRKPPLLCFGSQFH